MKRLQIFLSGREMGIVCTLISIIAINCWQLIVPNFENDNSYYLAAAKNIFDGHGYTIQMVSASDFSKPFFDPISKWPPGYSSLLVLIHWLTNLDWIHSGYCLNALGLTALVFTFRKILLQLEFPDWIVNIIVLYFGFLKHPYHFSFYADIFGLLFFLIGLSLMLSGIKYKQELRWKIVLSGMFLGFSCFMKYLYLPLSVVPIMTLIVYARYIKRKSLTKAALWGSLFLALSLCSLLMVTVTHTSETILLNPTTTGFFPNQIYRFAPVIPETFINLDFVNMQVSNLKIVRYETLNIFWSVVNLGCFAWLVYILYKVFTFKKPALENFKTFYLILSVLISGVLISYLVILSVTKSSHYSDTFSPWVYVQEFRYYAIVSVFVIQFAAMLYMKREIFFNKYGQMILQWLFFIIVIGEIGHGTYFIVKQMFIKKYYATRIEGDQNYFKSLMLVDLVLKNEKNLVFCSNSPKFPNMANLKGIPAFYDLSELKMPIKTSRPLTFIIASDTSSPNPSIPFLSSLNTKPDLIFRSVFYYIVKVPKSIQN
jgi:hypothetical protein